MSKKNLSAVVLTLFAAASIASAHADSFCRLKGGSMVALDAASCAHEGGAPVVVTITPAATMPTTSAPVTISAPLSADPKLAAAQRAVITLLDTSVLDRDSQARIPEGIERSATFDECRLMVNENMHIDHSKIFTSHMSFKISSSVDFRTLNQNSYAVMGKTDSLAGGLKAYSVYLEEYKHSSGNSLNVAMQEQYEGVYRKANLPGPSAYWTTPHDDFYMVDDYGYPVQSDTGLGNIATNKIRLLFVVGTENEAVALKKSFDDVRALCKR